MNLETTVSVLLELCHLIHSKGLVSGSGGNVSLRCGEELLITPSGRSLQLLKAEDLVHLFPDGTYHSGNGSIPSKEWRMHLYCYERPDVNAVIHVHSVHAIAASCMENVDPDCVIPVYSPGYGIRVGKLPMLPYLEAGSEALAKACSDVIAWRNSVMLANHGVLAVGETSEEALNIIEEIEDEAKILFLLGGHGRALTEDQQALLPPMGLNPYAAKMR